MQNAPQSLITELKQQGITHLNVLDAIRAIPRQLFVLPSYQEKAYANQALPIDCQQTISQPYVVALMTQALFPLSAESHILEIGTGSGYQTAILARLFKQVWTIERFKKLQQQAKTRLQALGLHNVTYQIGDGYHGWQAAAPFQGILVTAAIPTLPPPLWDQLHPQGGKIIIPLGLPNKVQTLTLIQKNGKEAQEKILETVCFVPLISSS